MKQRRPRRMGSHRPTNERGTYYVAKESGRYRGRRRAPREAWGARPKVLAVIVAAVTIGVVAYLLVSITDPPSPRSRYAVSPLTQVPPAKQLDPVRTVVGVRGPVSVTVTPTDTPSPELSPSPAAVEVEFGLEVTTADPAVPAVPVTSSSSDTPLIGGDTPPPAVTPPAAPPPPPPVEPPPADPPVVDPPPAPTPAPSCTGRKKHHDG